MLNSVPGRKDGYDPLIIIRIVNYFQRQGKDVTLKELRIYASNTSAIEQRHRVPENIETADLDSQRTLMPLLFPSGTDHKEPLGSIGYRAHPPFMYRDIPFDLFDRSRTGHSGAEASSNNVELDWIEKFGSMPEQPLRPTDDPLGAADEVLSVVKEKSQGMRSSIEQVGDDEFRAYYRWQAWKMIKGLLKDQSEELKARNEL